MIIIYLILCKRLTHTIGIIIYRRNRRLLVRQVAEKQKSIIPRGDLVLHNRIGRGASGEVVKASFRGTDVAVKKIITSNVSKNVLQDFEMEVAIMWYGKRKQQ